MKCHWIIPICVCTALLIFQPSFVLGGQQDDSVISQLELFTYLGMQCIKGSKPGESLQTGGLQNINVKPNSPLGNYLTKLGFGLKIQEISFFSPDDKGMTRREEDKLLVAIPNEWRMPFTVRMQGNKQLPKVEFKGGELIWDYRKSNVTAKNGTLARINNREYQYSSGRWERALKK